MLFHLKRILICHSTTLTESLLTLSDINAVRTSCLQHTSTAAEQQQATNTKTQTNTTNKHGNSESSTSRQWIYAHYIPQQRT